MPLLFELKDLSVEKRHPIVKMRCQFFLSDKAVGLQLCNDRVRKFLCACGAAHILRQCFPFGNDIGYGFFDCRCRLCLAQMCQHQGRGLILCCPAISGAEPWIGSKIAPSLPIFALGVRPRPPTRPAHKSETISP